MAPASASRKSQRTRRSAADVADSSPSRPAKRRKRVPSSSASPSLSTSRAPSAALSAALSTTDSHEPQDSIIKHHTHAHDGNGYDDDDDDEDDDDDDVVARVTQHLKAQPVHAAKDHANTIHEANGDGVKAYAKVAAHDWTFYITKLSVNIGRAPEALPSSADRHDAPDDTDTDTSWVHIDLGPSKMVSREHASISFDSKQEHWLLHVKGRNGAKLDGQPCKPAVSQPLTSGQVIEIANVEMMFVLPSEISRLQIHPIFLSRCRPGPELCSLSLPLQQPPATSRQPPRLAPAPPHHSRLGTPPPVSSSAMSGTSTAMTPAVMVGAHGVNLSLDENQHIKPQFSYAQMITQAIIDAPDGKLNLNAIYKFIMRNYSYYRHQHAAGWQNSIRHNLSLNKSFDKVARSTDEPGKGMKWQIVPESRDEMIRNAFKIGRGGHRGSSAPSSPNQLGNTAQASRDVHLRDTPSIRKRRPSPLISPSPRTSLNIVTTTPARVIDGSPLPRLKRPAAHDSARSPTLTSSYLQDDGTSFATPAPPKIHPRLAPPSTAQRPSQHMPTSSPAPFWKYADIGSTPLKPLAQYDLSPTKPTSRMLPQSSSPVQPTRSPPSSPLKPPKNTVSHERPTADDPDEEQGFDLTKGFQSIGSYHAPVGRGIPVADASQDR
ncbi:hypothetical protein CDD81_4660 [Ophiocordyceps australis]|uniref:Fork-head domain-containing protein n=1 Tax=Ophiocordyceps australis TaxID=1399860 RepID=A0A2C5XTJ8_9HYPO|nr:hypothetical protein CDD81_4660 [Ophiocordyceps australis]